MPGAGAGAAEQFYLEPEPEPEPDYFPGAGAGVGADQKCHGSASLIVTHSVDDCSTEAIGRWRHLRSHGRIPTCFSHIVI